jgi:hypothetical protein
MHDQRDRDIGEQRQGQPLQDFDIPLVARKNLQNRASRGEQHDVEPARPANQQAQPIAHRAEIGAEINEIRGEQQHHDRAQQPDRIVLAQIGGDALPRHAADPGADLLDGRHQRPGEQHDPARRITELGASLRVGSDAARVIVGSAGDQPRPEHGQDAAPWITVADLAAPRAEMASIKQHGARLQEVAQQLQENLQLIVMHPMAGAIDGGDLGIPEMREPSVLLGI